MAYAATFIELSSMTLDGEGRDLIKETDERKRKRGSTFEAFRTCPPTHAARINFRDDRPQRFSMSLSLRERRHFGVNVKRLETTFLHAIKFPDK